ncbi:TPA: hypothetical protein ACIX2I_005223, partial [Escherichia coli]
MNMLDVSVNGKRRKVEWRIPTEKVGRLTRGFVGNELSFELTFQIRINDKRGLKKINPRILTVFSRQCHLAAALLPVINRWFMAE